MLSGRRIPSLIVGPLDRAVFTPYEMRRHRLEHAADATHGFWARVGDRVAISPRRVMVGSIAVLLILCAGFAFFSTDLTSEDSYRDRSRIGRRPAPARQELPLGHDRAHRRRRPRTAPKSQAVRSAVEGVDGVEAVSRPVAEGPPGTLVQATLEPNPYSTEAFDLVEPIREAAHGVAPGDPGRRADRGRIRRPRRGRLGLDRDPADHPRSSSS